MEKYISMPETIESLDSRVKSLENTSQKTLEIVTELKMAICGSDKIGLEGIVKKINRHEKYINQDKELKLKIFGGFTIISLLSGLIIKFWEKIF
jgi:hypothetical protein